MEGSHGIFVPLEDSPEESGAHSLRLTRIRKPVVTIQGPFDASAFNRVALKAELGRPSELDLHFIHDRGRATVSYRIPPRTGNTLRIIHIDSPELARLEGELREIRLSLKGQTRYVRIDWIDLLLGSCGTFFPDPAVGPAMIDLVGELRSGVGVVTGRPVEVRFMAPERGSLHFAYGLPPRWRDTESKMELQLVLTGTAGELARNSWPLDPVARPHWRTAHLPITANPGEVLEARWEILGEGHGACALAEVGVLTRANAPGRVLLITSDTHRFDHLGTAGRGVEVRTPALDALARSGLLFEDCFSSTNITNPSHIALMTATHPRDMGILTNTERMSDAVPTLAEAFRSAGYATWAAVSSNHLDDSVSGLGQGFDRMSVPASEAVRDAEGTVDRIVDWIEERGDTPCFIWLHLFDAHTPYDPPTNWAREYYPDIEAAFDPSRPPPEDPPARLYEDQFPGLKDLEYPRALYRGEVAYLDAELRRLFGHPGLQDAIIGFTADHGESLGEHGLYYTHAGLYPDSIHVPMIIRHPDGPSGVRCSAPVKQIDLGRTLLDLSGNSGIAFPGSNLLSALERNEEPHGVRFALSALGLSASMTEHGWHLMLQLQFAGGPSRRAPCVRHRVELYYLPDDLECLDDRLEAEPARAKRMRQKLIDWLARAEDRGRQGEMTTDAGVLRNLEALGYTADGYDATPVGELFDPSCECEWCKRFR